jgi:hypothetical protein
MPFGSQHPDTGDVMRQRGFRIVLVWMLLAVLQAGMKLYVIQEIFSVLLVTAVAVIALVLVPVTFVLLQSGTRRAWPWLKTNIVPLAIWMRRQVREDRLQRDSDDQHCGLGTVWR